MPFLLIHSSYLDDLLIRERCTEVKQQGYCIYVWETPKETSKLQGLTTVFSWMKKGTRDEQLKEMHPGKVSRNKMFTLIYLLWM